MAVEEVEVIGFMFDGPPSAEGGPAFIDTFDETGYGVGVGRWEKNPTRDDLWVLWVPVAKSAVRGKP